MSLDFERKNRGKKAVNPLLMIEGEKQKNEFRRNIKLTDPIFYKIKALMTIRASKQYELIEEMADFYIKHLSDQEKAFYEFKLDEITKAEEAKKQK